jgi:hypothetical protein
MNRQEYSERLDNLQRLIAKHSEAQRKAQDLGDHAENVRLQGEIGVLIDAGQRLKEEARQAGLPV